jgi:transposase InsO family protein
MRRREFITLIGGAATWPLAASAQPSRPFRVAYLAFVSGQDSTMIMQRLQELGYHQGENLEFAYRSADGRPELLASLARPPPRLLIRWQDQHTVKLTQDMRAIDRHQQLPWPRSPRFGRDLSPTRRSSSRPKNFCSISAGDLIQPNLRLITGRQTGVFNRHLGIGWEYVHVCIDDASRVAFVEVMADQRKESVVTFLKAAVAYYAKLGIRIERVMTDNGSCYRSKAFRSACKRLDLRQVFITRRKPMARPSASSGSGAAQNTDHPPQLLRARRKRPRCRRAAEQRDELPTLR